MKLLPFVGRRTTTSAYANVMKLVTISLFLNTIFALRVHIDTEDGQLDYNNPLTDKMTIQVSSSDNAQQQPSVVANNNTAITTATDDNNNNNSNSSSVPATESAVRRLLRPIGTTPPPFDVFPVIEHPFPPIYADAAVYKDNAVPTCSWLSNLFYPSVENRAPTTPDPYILRFLDPVGDHPGVSISQPHDKVIGSYPAVNNVPPTPAGYMINGVTVDFRITANEWTQAKKPTMKVKDWDLFGAKLQLLSSGSAAAAGMEIPLARGTPFITARYQALTPQFYSQHAIVNIQSVNGTSNNSAEATYQGTKFKMTFNDNPASTYLIYALNGPLTLRKVDTNNLVATGTYNGTVQIAKLPRPEDESVLDAHSGVWAVGAQLDATTNKQQYTIRWKLEGDMSKTLLTYAYPHHLKSFASSARIEKTPLILQSSTKGAMQAVIGNTWTLEEPDLPTAINWFPQNAAVTDPATRNDILGVLEDDILESNYTEHTQRGDNYFSGKGLQKFALLALLLNHPEVTQFNDPVLAQTALDKLKESFVPYLENRQEDPFLYDTMYKGIVAKKGLPESMGGTGDRNAEFGHAYYNDHHYHQGYLIVTAAMIHYMDPTWRAEELKTWTETLIRDVNNPVEEEDVYFAPFRNWDWFAGHSWAGGIKVDGAMDGRDQESVPESVNFYWGMKLWALATKNTDLENLANLQLALMKRTAYEYFWMLDGNENRPAEMVKNKVAGIFFEQKLDYTTYFGRYVEYIHGIQQLPMTPILADYMRTSEFVKQEWEQRLATIAPSVRSGWAGVLYLNYAIINPSEAYQKLKESLIDDGQTRAYSLYLAATRSGFSSRALAKVTTADSTTADSVDTARKPNAGPQVHLKKGMTHHVLYD